jgi:hypothetical protein
MNNNITRFRVLRLYKRIIKLSHSWEASNHPSKTREEQLYIRNEARELFRKNQHVCCLIFYSRINKSLFR